MSLEQRRSTVLLDPRLDAGRNQMINYYDISTYVGIQARKNIEPFYGGNTFQKEIPYGTYFKNNFPVGGVHKEYATFPCECHTKGEQYSFPHLG